MSIEFITVIDSTTKIYKMKAKFNNSLPIILSMTVLMACSSTRNATAQYPNDDYGTYQNDDYYNNDETYNDDDGYYDDPSESDVNINVFVDALNPYGRWINSPSYGQVWICNMPDFTPYYSGGHWVYTNYGWTWASDYSWGWAPFHYGRWAYDPFYGWMWVPGYQWGPAWVGWRTGGDYYGWAPLAPGINISVGFGFGNAMPADRWCFVPRRYIGYSNFGHYMVNRSRNVTIIRNTTIINNTNIYHNTRYVTGPNRREVERYTGRRINEVRVNNSSRPGASRVTNNTINIYRPQINKKEVTKKNVDVNINKRQNGAPSHDGNNPNKDQRIIRTPDRRNDNTNNNNNNNNRKPDPRDRINNDNRNNRDNNDINRNNDQNRDRNNDIRNRPPQNDNRFPNRNNNNRNNDQKNKQYNQRPPVQNDNRFPNRNYDQQNRQNSQRPPSDWNRNQQQQNRNFDQNRNYQRPDFNNRNNNNNNHSWQPSQQQRNMQQRPAPQQQNNNKRRPS